MLEHFELKLFNENNENNEEHYCCICLNTTNCKYIKLRCCDKEIHSECILDWIITETNVNYKCPVCIKLIKLTDVISIGNIIDYIVMKKKIITKAKFDSLFNKLYNISLLISDDCDLNLQENTIEIYNNKLKLLFLYIMFLCTLFIILVYILYSL